MTSNKQIVSQVAIAYCVLLFLGSRNQIGRTVWVLLNLHDTLRALKDMYPNGRRIGVVTRRRRLRAALAGWIVLVAVQPITFVADTLLSWIPFYSSIKMLLVLALSFWRLESSAFLFQTLVVPVVRRYETHIDLTLLLLGSTVLLFFHFLVELPWSTMVALAKYPSRRVIRVSAYEAPVPSVDTSTATTPSRPTRPASTSTGRPSAVETQEGSKLKSFRPTSPHQPRGPRKPEDKAHHGPLTTTRKTAATVAKHGRVRAAAQSLDVASAPSAANRESHRSTSTNGRGKASEAPALRARAPSTRTDTTQQAKVIPPISKPAERRAMRSVPSNKTASTRSQAHSARVHASMKTLPPAPSHDPQQPTIGVSQHEPTHTTTLSGPTPKTEARRSARGQKRARPDDEEYQDRGISTARSTHAMSTRSTPRKAKAVTKTSAPVGVQRGRAVREPARLSRSAATMAGDMPHVKRVRISKK